MLSLSDFNIWNNPSFICEQIISWLEHSFLLAPTIYTYHVPTILPLELRFTSYEWPILCYKADQLKNHSCKIFKSMILSVKKNGIAFLLRKGMHNWTLIISQGFWVSNYMTISMICSILSRHNIRSLLYWEQEKVGHQIQEGVGFQTSGMMQPAG